MSHKIGILTFAYSTNPGSVLQAYSLQQHISSIDNYDAHIINYHKTRAGKPIIGKTVFVRPIKNWSVRKVLEWTARILWQPFKMAKYEKFFNTHYNGYPTEPCSRNDLKNIADKYDAFVVGSDQVWNFDSDSVDDTYFLDFVKDGRKKISYAASFGQKGVPQNEHEKVAKLIADFSSISVREKYGVETVSALTGKEAKWVLDPSLLTDAGEYRKMAKHKNKGKYVLVYLREESEELMAFADKLAKCYGLKVIKVLRHWMCGKNGKAIHIVGPETWLGYMDNAEYVLTNSFHGICFSIIFEKQFFVDVLKNGRISSNPRIESILDQFDLRHRLIDGVEDVKAIEVLEYKKINEIMEKQKAESLQYLKDAIERSVN